MFAALSNMLDVVLCFAFVGFIAVLLLHRALWIPLQRSLQAVQNILPNRKLVGTLGAILVVAPFATREGLIARLLQFVPVP